MDMYEQYKQQLEALEHSFDQNSTQCLQQMADLYLRLQGTVYHDLADAIQLWMYHHGNATTLNYLQQLHHASADVLIKIITNKITGTYPHVDHG